MKQRIAGTNERVNDIFAKKLYYVHRWRQQEVRSPSRVRLNTFHRYARLISAMSKPSAVILDVGCDSGILSRMLESEGMENLIGVELVNRFKHEQKISFVVCENTRLPFRRKSIDVIFARKFVSVQDVEGSLNTFHEVLKDEGRLFIEVPNVKRLKSRLYEALGLTPPYPPKYFPPLHLASFRKILHDTRFSLLKVEGDHVFVPLLGNLLHLFKLDKLENVLGLWKPTLCLHLLGICKKQ
jgi:ubiquinone/menaquinone biosynthesis C-methylase UbiE